MQALIPHPVNTWWVEFRSINAFSPWIREWMWLNLFSSKYDPSVSSERDPLPLWTRGEPLLPKLEGLVHEPDYTLEWMGTPETSLQGLQRWEQLHRLLRKFSISCTDGASLFSIILLLLEADSSMNLWSFGCKQDMKVPNKSLPDLSKRMEAIQMGNRLDVPSCGIREGPGCILSVNRPEVGSRAIGVWRCLPNYMNNHLNTV